MAGIGTGCGIASLPADSFRPRGRVLALARLRVSWAFRAVAGRSAKPELKQCFDDDSVHTLAIGVVSVQVLDQVRN